MSGVLDELMSWFCRKYMNDARPWNFQGNLLLSPASKSRYGWNLILLKRRKFSKQPTKANCKIFERLWPNIPGADPEPPLPGGTSDQWSRRLHWGAKRRKGEGGGGVTPSRWWGSGGLPREILGNLHQNGAFWAHLEVTYAYIYNWKYIWKTCLTINILFQNSSRI